MNQESANAIEVRDLVKRFGDFVAVDHLNLDIHRGELLSLLGPNGAGKTTTLGILTTLLSATEGSVVIAGWRVPDQNDRLKPLLGLVPQEIALYDTFSARRNLRFFARMYGLSGADLETRISEMLEGIELSDRADDAVRTLSGGMQRRVNIAAALVHDPEIIFMDEPTVGLDPISRTAIWKVIEQLKARGKTIVLTTHYMEEAQALSDRVCIVDHGKVIALGTTDELIRETGVRNVLSVSIEGQAEACLAPLRALPDVKEVHAADGQLHVYSEVGALILPQIIQNLLNLGVVIQSVEVRTPDLGAVFLHFSGHELRG